MLRISEGGKTGEAATLRLEGRVMRDGVGEVRRVCEQLLMTGHHLTLDMAEVSFVDRGGIALLQELKGRGVALANCSQFLTEQLKQAAPLSS